MRRLLLFASVAVVGLSIFAQGGQLADRSQMLSRSEMTFGDLKGFENMVVLNTQPRMIVLTRPGETMMCPMPNFNKSLQAQSCWQIGN